MIEVGGRPILWHIMKMYAAHGVNDFIICLGYRGYVIKEYFANYFLHMSDVTFDMRENQMEVHHRHAEPWRVTLVDTGESTMTGGRLRRAGISARRRALLFYLWRRRGRPGHGGAVRLPSPAWAFGDGDGGAAPGRYGALVRNGDAVAGFEEKPRGDGGWINGGFLCCSPRVIDHIEGDATSGEIEPMATLAQTDQLRAFEHAGFWQPMDTLREKTCWKSFGRRACALEMLVSMRPEPDFWHGKRVLLSGHTGFKGHGWRCGCSAWGPMSRGLHCRPPPSPAFCVGPGGAGHRKPFCDVRDAQALADGVRAAGRDRVAPGGAGLVRPSYAAPLEHLPPMSWAPPTCSMRCADCPGCAWRWWSPPTRSTATVNGPTLP